MPNNTRDNNQYFGKHFEKCIVAQINGETEMPESDFKFTEQELQDMWNEAEQIKNYIGTSCTATHVGDHTSTADGDIVLDNGEIIEIKRVSNGSGTYYGTSIYYLNKFGFDFKEYMEQYGLYQALETNFSNMVTINRQNNSPVNNASSKLIRHDYPEIYEDVIQPINDRLQKDLVQNVANYLVNNPEKAYEFYLDMINKTESRSKKQAPDRIIVFNYIKNSIYEIQPKALKNKFVNEITTTDKGLIIGNLRIAFGWQNGIGLNNPTLRVFIKEV